MYLSVVLVAVCLSVSQGHRVPGYVQDETDLVQDPGHYLNSFLVRVDKRDVAEQVALDHGFKLVEQLPQLDIFLLEHPEVVRRSRRSADDFISRLREDPRVMFAEQEITLKRVKRTHEVLHDKQLEFPIDKITDRNLFYRVPGMVGRRGDIPVKNDENYDDMWYLHNRKQTGGKEDIDLNVEPAWKMGYTGRGVVVTILDDGIDHTHPDLRRNYDPDASADFNDADDEFNDPTPDKSTTVNSHGTRCAGEIASEADNGICGVGVAYDSRIGGIRILDGRVTDSLEAKALLLNNQHIDIYSASWGPQDNGEVVEGTKPACKAALEEGVKTGRGNKGSIFVWATGNGGGNGDHCGADGYVSSPESISVQSMTDKGALPFFGERCCSTMCAVPTGGEKTKDEERKARFKIKVVTTDINGGCVENFEGTSSAAPLAAGCLALVLQANPDLTWRDVQHIITKTSRITVDDGMWTINGAKLHVNSKFGFGMMDCTRMVETALDWKSVPEQHVCAIDEQVVNSEIPKSGCHKLTFDFDGCQGRADSVTNLEHTQVHIKMSIGRRGNAEIFLTSPAGTRSELLLRRPNDSSDKGIDFDFMTVHNWMENPHGQWVLEVCHNPGTDRDDTTTPGVFESYVMRAYGYENKENLNKQNEPASKPSSDILRTTMEEEYRRSRQVNLKRAQNGYQRGSPSQRENPPQREKTNEVAKEVDDFLTDLKHLFGARSLQDLYADERMQENRGYTDIDKEEDRGYPNFEKKENRGYPDILKEDVRGYPDVDEEDVRGYPNVEDVDLDALKAEVLDELTNLSDRDLENVFQLYEKRKVENKRRERIHNLIKEIRGYLVDTYA